MWWSQGQPPSLFYIGFWKQTNFNFKILIWQWETDSSLDRCCFLREGREGRILPWKISQHIHREKSSHSMASAFSTGKPFPFSQSACELNYPRKRSEPTALSPTGSPIVIKKSQRTRMPWYISVIHEKVESQMPPCPAHPVV